MEKRFEEQAYRRHPRKPSSVRTGKRFTDDEMKALAHGADEADLVNSGLEDTMGHRLPPPARDPRPATRACDLRTAAFIDAINKIAICYEDLGIFP